MAPVIWIALSLGCADSDEAESEDLELIELGTQVLTTDDDGYAQLTLDIEAGTHAFLLRATSEDYTVVTSLVDPDGNEVVNWDDWMGFDHLLTMGVFPYNADAILNWPVRADDGPLQAGPWTATVRSQTYNGYAMEEEDIEIQAFSKQDAVLDEGNVAMRVVYPEAIASDNHVVASVEAAIDQWRVLWQPYGLTLSVRYEVVDIDIDLPNPGHGDEVYLDASAEAETAELTMVIGETIDMADDEFYGVSGGIPGGLTPSQRSVVTVSWLACSGSDGVFSEEEILQMAETMAHEVGHYSGMFHPVEMSFAMWDALDDTPECDDYQSCEELLGANIMYPYPVCGLVYCEPSTELTDSQVGVAQRWTGML